MQLRNFILPALAALAVAGCAGDRPTAPDSPASPSAPAWTVTTVGDQVTINNYVVTFQGRVFDGTNTTFAYHVVSVDAPEDLSHFNVELPACASAIVSLSPSNSANVNTNQDSGIYGVEWHINLDRDDTVGQVYSITFAGDVAPGLVRAQVSAGSTFGVAVVPGPCAGYHLTGNVFEDADQNGLHASDESGINNVTVVLTDAYGARRAFTTGPDGAYDFLVPGGAYTVAVAAATVETDFNESLYESFAPNSPASVALNVTADAVTDFGFIPQSQKLINELDSGILLTNGRPVKFWKDQLKVAISGNGRATYDRAALLAFLQTIEGYFIADPFTFTDGNELVEAYNILNASGRDDLTNLRKELLACEFNTAAGRGIIGALDTQLVLISWGESLVADATSAVVTSATGTVTTMAGGTKNVPSDGTTLLGLINGSTGGGGGDE